MSKYICLECFNKELILWDDNNKATCNSCKNTFTKDKLLLRIKEYNNKQFEIINHGLPDPTFKPGGISTTIRRVKCPLCKHKFNQKIESGCFGGTAIPFFCPKCEYSYSITRLYFKLKNNKDL